MYLIFMVNYMQSSSRLCYVASLCEAGNFLLVYDIVEVSVEDSILAASRWGACPNTN